LTSKRRIGGLDPEKIRKAITSKTKAILVVHLYGNPAKVSELKEIAEEKGIYLIEDCAEAHGAEYEGKKVGNFGDIGRFRAPLRFLFVSIE